MSSSLYSYMKTGGILLSHSVVVVVGLWEKVVYSYCLLGDVLLVSNLHPSLCIGKQGVPNMRGGAGTQVK